MDGRIFSAWPMDPESVGRIAEKFSERMEAPVTLTQEVDPSLIAGFIVQIGFLRFDYSARARILELKRHMRDDS